MRIATTADLHGYLPDVPECDILVIAGDVTPTADHDVEYQARWLDTEFRSWLEAAPARSIVGIAGNHDFVFDRAPALVPGDLPWTYLQDTAATVGGLRFWGSPWTPWFFDWAFNAPEGEAGEPFLAERYDTVPEDTDVLVIHGPPRGYGDLTSRGMTVGSQAQLELVRRVQPVLCVYGHIHEARGIWELGPTRLVNASAVDLQYQLHAEPVVVHDLGHDDAD